MQSVAVNFLMKKRVLETVEKVHGLIGKQWEDIFLSQLID